MTLTEIIRWLKEGQRAVQQSQRRQIASTGFAFGITAFLGMAVIGTTNPLLLFNPGFHPSWVIRFWSLWSVVVMGSVWVRLVDNAIKAGAPRLYLHGSPHFFDESRAIDAPFFEPENRQ
jgi:hypothetical protein